VPADPGTVPPFPIARGRRPLAAVGSSTGPSVTTWFRMCVNVSGDSVRVPPPEGDTSMGYEPALSGRPHIGASSGG
jgi:hypothetical protein